MDTKACRVHNGLKVWPGEKKKIYNKESQVRKERNESTRRATEEENEIYIEKQRRYIFREEKGKMIVNEGEKI